MRRGREESDIQFVTSVKVRHVYKTALIRLYCPMFTR